MIFAILSLLATLTSSDAVLVLLNSRNAVSPAIFAEARQIVQREADAGKPVQQFVIGVTTNDSTVAERYLDASRKKIKAMAIEKDNALAWYLLSVEKNDIRCLRKAASAGNVQALNALGLIVTEEASRSRNLPPAAVSNLLAQGFGYFRQAAEKRDPNGYVNVATCYLGGTGCQRNPEVAFAYYLAAAEAGHPEGMDSLSDCYRYGRGVKRDEDLSLYWKMRARATRGDQPAAKWLETRK